MMFSPISEPAHSLAQFVETSPPLFRTLLIVRPLGIQVVLVQHVQLLSLWPIPWSYTGLLAYTTRLRRLDHSTLC